ncbi:hypothetical protein Trydic_g8835 [Trypoxylus dichotomus]
MKSTQINKLYKAVGFAEPSERRKSIEYVEKYKQTFNYGQEQQRKGLKLRKNFLQCAVLEAANNYPINESPCAGSNLDWKKWKRLNGIRTGVESVKTPNASGKLKNINNGEISTLCPSIDEM